MPFAEQVPAADVDELTYELKGDATVENVRVVFPAGPEGELHIRVSARSQEGQERPIPVYRGNDYINGEGGTDGEYDLATSEPVEEGEEIVVAWDNLDGVNAHRFTCVVDVDYRGGLESVIDGVLR